MYNNKLIKLLKTLNRKEMTRFRAFVDSPYFNKHEKVRELVKHLEQLYPSFVAEKCDRKVLSVAIGETEMSLAVLFTYTKRLLYEFLIVEQRSKEGNRQQLALLQQLRQREQYAIYEKKLQQLSTTINQTQRQDIEYHFDTYQLTKEENCYYEQRREYKNDHSLTRKQLAFNHFFIAEKLKDACELLSRQSTLNVDFSDRLFTIILAELKDNWATYEAVPSIVIYHQIYQLLKQQTFEAYNASLQSLEQYASLLNIEEQRTAYLYVQNFCASQSNAGKTNYLQHLFDLLRLQLKKNLLIENDYLSQWHYKNIVTSGLRLGEQKWVHNFIEQYKTQLHPDQREQAYTFNLASYYYYYQQYKKALELLLYLDLSDVRYAITAKSMLLYTYYELDEQEALLTLTRTFQQYLKRQKGLANNYSQGVNHLITFTRKLALLRARKDFQHQTDWQRRFDQLQAEIVTEKNIVNKKWLLEKVEGLK